jgi:hypothetical protein
MATRHENDGSSACPGVVSLAVRDEEASRHQDMAPATGCNRRGSAPFPIPCPFPCPNRRAAGQKLLPPTAIGEAPPRAGFRRPSTGSRWSPAPPGLFQVLPCGSQPAAGSAGNRRCPDRRPIRTPRRQNQRTTTAPPTPPAVPRTPLQPAVAPTEAAHRIAREAVGGPTAALPRALPRAPPQATSRPRNSAQSPGRVRPSPRPPSTSPVSSPAPLSLDTLAAARSRANPLAPAPPR